MTGAPPLDPSSRAFFEAMYEATPDPWDFSVDPYERDRYRSTLEHVPAGRFRTAFEPGCSVGVLTEALAGRCERVIAVDIAAEAVRRTQTRCAALPHVSVRRGALPEAIPPTPVDLVVFSEVGYYLDGDALAEVVRGLADRLTPGGRMVAVHWLGRSPDHRLHGREVHRVITAQLTAHPTGPTRAASEEHPHPERDGFLLDVWDFPAGAPPIPDGST